MTGYHFEIPPSHLIRAFRENSHREAFLSGHLRMQHISSYRSTGDAREDATEGVSYIRIPGNVQRLKIDRPTMDVLSRETVDSHFNHQSQYLNPTYILSCSTPEVDQGRLTSSFGEHLIQIDNPEELLRRVYQAARGEIISGRTLNFLDAFYVRYTKGNVAAEPASVRESLRLDYGQKPIDHLWEAEYRTVLSFNGPLHSFPRIIQAEVGSLRDIARPVG